VKSVLLIKSIK